MVGFVYLGVKMVNLAFNYSVEIQTNTSEEVNDMAWDYRVIFMPFEEGSDEGEYTIREVYYDEEGEISWYGDDPAQLLSDNFWELADDFDLMAEAFEKPVLVLVGDELVEDDEEYEQEEEEEEA